MLNRYTHLKVEDIALELDGLVKEQIGIKTSGGWVTKTESHAKVAILSFG